MAFFKQFPQIDYDIQENGEISKIYDMYRHVDVVNKKTDDFTSYTFYEIKDGDRPDIISQKLYGTPDYYWTFFIINDFLQHGYNYFYKSYQTFMRGLQLEYEGKGALVVLPNYTNSFNVLGGIDITNDIINVIRKKTVNDYELVNMILRDDRPSINTVEVRRNVDGTEKVFTIDEVTDGTLEGFVNASFNDELPLDQATGAAAAYSLRKLKEDFTGDVVEVRRNVDGETEGFTADEVTDGTLESFVNASVDDKLPLDQSTGAAAAYSLRNLKASGTDVTTSGDTAGDTTGKYVVQVRRSSDDAVKSFTAAEVADGTLESWVNADLDITNRLIVPSDIATRFVVTSSTDASNYNASIDNDSASTDFVQIRSGLFGEGRYRLRGTLEVSDLVGNLSIQTNGGVASGTQNVGLSNGTNNLDFEFDITGDGSTTSAGSTLLYFLIPSGTSATLGVSNLTWEVTQADGHVRTWYDQSGSDNHAVQTTDANQPKIVEGGSLVTDRDGKVALNGKGAKLDLPANAPMLSSDGSYSLFAAVDFDDQRNGNDNFNNILRFDSTTAGGASSARKPLVYLGQSNGSLSSTGPSFNNGSVSYTLAETLSVQLFTNIANPALSTGNHTLYADGDLVGSTNNATDVNTNTLLSTSSQIFDNQETTVTHFLSEVIYYPSDQSDKRRAIEENIANHYDITLAAFSRDGTVSTWYDQSGNTNDAVQTDAAKQPKIVENGSVLEDSAGNPEIDFDGTSHRFDIDFGSNLPQPNSIFMVHQSDSVLEADNEFFDEKDTTGQRTLLDVSTVGAENRYRMRAKTSLSSTNIQVTTDKNLVSAIYNGSNSSMSLNGDSFNFTNTVGSDSIARLSSIGFSEGTGNYYDGTMQEFIIYNSDQSTKRRAIEENIANHYDITLAAFSRDGTVKTWTYQIGTNDDPSSQPKIVVDGSLLTNNTQLSSLNEVEVMTVSDPISWNPHNLQLIVDNVTDESIFFDDSSIDRYSLAFKDSATSEQKVEWLKEFNEAQRELKGPTYINLNENTLSSFEFTAERRYEELITAPYSYYATIDVADRVSVGDTINAYDAARSGYGDLDQFTTYYQHEEDENELSRKLKVVRPQEIEQFTEQYKTLINS